MLLVVGSNEPDEIPQSGIREVIMTEQRLLWKLRRWMTPYMISTIMVACRNFLITWLTAYIGSSVLNMVSEGSTGDFFGQLLYITLFIGVFLVFDTTGIYWQSVTIHGIKNSLQSILYSSVLKARYDKVYCMGQKGELLSRMNSDVEMVSSVLSFGILTPLMTLISGIGATITVAGIHWKLCVIIYWDYCVGESRFWSSGEEGQP